MPRNNFIVEALKVCEEAEAYWRSNPTWKDPGAMLDMQRIAQLQFIERVLNG